MSRRLAGGTGRKARFPAREGPLAPPDGATLMRSSLFLFRDRVAWASPGQFGALTRRPVCALLIGAYGPVAIELEGGRRLRSRALLVAQDVARKLDARGAGFYNLNLDPLYPPSRYLREELLRGREVLDVSARLDPEVIEAVTWAVENTGDCKDSRRISDLVLQRIFPGASAARPVDGRVARVAEWLRQALPTRAHLPELRALCNLSAGRLTHLFAQEIGVPIRSYLLWSKMLKAAELFAQDMPLTTVAATIGFTDSAHLTRVFQAQFSLAPSFLVNRERVHVTACMACGRAGSCGSGHAAPDRPNQVSR